MNALGATLQPCASKVLTELSSNKAYFWAGSICVCKAGSRSTTEDARDFALLFPLVRQGQGMGSACDIHPAWSLHMKRMCRIYGHAWEPFSYTRKPAGKCWQTGTCHCKTLHQSALLTHRTSSAASCGDTLCPVARNQPHLRKGDKPVKASHP